MSTLQIKNVKQLPWNYIIDDVAQVMMGHATTRNGQTDNTSVLVKSFGFGHPRASYSKTAKNVQRSFASYTYEKMYNYSIEAALFIIGMCYKLSEEYIEKCNILRNTGTSEADRTTCI